MDYSKLKTDNWAYPCKFLRTTATEDRSIILHSSSHSLKAAARTRRADFRPTLKIMVEQLKNTSKAVYALQIH